MGTKITYKNAAKQDFLAVMRALVRAYQEFAAYDAAGHRAAGLTSPQADVLFALGNTEGLTFREIGEKTLITKGTLTGIIDRLEYKRLVQRVTAAKDKRCTLVRLTEKGTQVFQEHFPQHIAYLKTRFDRLSPADKRAATRLLQKIRTVF
jgi:DNA-binding MarR family transcriptional regulator